jgi:antitoxin component of MazEF toxin-antitoxin module
MEQIHQTIGRESLEIPLPLMQQYGLQPGDRVTLELGPEGIFMAVPIKDPQKIEILALKLTFRYLGDAVTVKAEQDTFLLNQQGWRVQIYGLGIEKPLGMLTFSRTGKLLPEFSTPFDEMRRQAMEDALAV